MALNAFDYAAPQSVDEAVSLLQKGNGKVGILAGGTDILPQLKENRRKIDLLLDIKKLPEANVLSFDASNGLRIGSAVSCSTTYNHPDVRTRYPALVDCSSLIGSVQIQNRATLGGNLCNASPAGDSPPAVIVLGGVCEVIGPNGQREIAAEDFFTAPGRNAMEAGEFLLAVRFPAPVAHSGAFFLRFIPRNEMDIAVANVAVSLVLDGDTITSARVAIGAVAPTPLLVAEAGAALVGQTISDETIEKACVATRAAAKPISDMRGTIEQRVHLTGVLTKRAIQGAIERAKES
ncbi:MAG: CO/xanthine dehydrogenase FAD-binding subunit [Candidatus Latescibacterota bacterium]|jgi:CO/xanthine dehydrogenase FAD-binding subunit